VDAVDAGRPIVREGSWWLSGRKLLPTKEDRAGAKASLAHARSKCRATANGLIVKLYFQSKRARRENERRNETYLNHQKRFDLDLITSSILYSHSPQEWNRWVLAKLNVSSRLQPMLSRDGVTNHPSCTLKRAVKLSRWVLGCTMVVCLCLAILGKSCGGIGQQRGSISAQVGRRNETGQEECCARQHHILLHSTCARCLDQRLEAAFPNLLLAFALLFFGSSPEQRCLKWNDTFLVRHLSPFLILLFCSCFILYYTNITMKFAILASLIACAAAFTNVPAKTAVRF